MSDYTCASSTCAPGKVCGHYPQLVGANTRRVGCAARLCPTVSGSSSFTNAQLVVCDYNPAGNSIGHKSYIAGRGASRCPADLPNVIDDLCSPNAVSATVFKQAPTLPGAGRVGLAAVLLLRGLRTRCDPQQPLSQPCADFVTGGMP